MEERVREGGLFGRFRFTVDEAAEAGGGDSEEIELELSLGGCFSSKDRGINRMVRSSSIPALLPLEAMPLERACSLPSVVEDELRRREEQSLRGMIGMRKMEEKKSLKRTCELHVEDLKGDSAGKIRGVLLENSGGAPSPGLPRWVAGAAGMLVSSKALPLASQGSIVSQGSCSSGGTELESRPRLGIEFSGFSSNSEIRSLSKVLNFSEHIAHVASSTNLTAKPADGTDLLNGLLPNRETVSKNRGELSRNMMEEMPCVSTKCDGPNGRRIEGFLYKYRRGEEVRIVCVCHGSFLSPAEFVKHAGWGDVAHPLRHIVVNPRPAAFL